MCVCVCVCVCAQAVPSFFCSLLPLSCRTPLHAAAFSGHVDCVQLLLSHDAPVDAADESGRTSLMMAAEKGRIGALGTEIFDSAYGFSTAVCLCCFMTFGNILMFYCFDDIRLIRV